MTGHGNVVLMTLTAIILKNYLLAGGFLHIDDNYGMNQYIRKEIKIFQIMSWLKYLQRTPFFKTYSFQMDYQKFMNTMENDHKLLVFYS
jgi:hypothetical protein